MPTDASILLGLKPMQTTNPMEMYEAGQRIETNRLAGIMNNMNMEEKQRSLQDAESQRGIVKGFGADTAANANMLIQGGHLKAAQDYSKAAGDLAKDNATTGKTRLEATGLALTQHRDQVNMIQSPDDVKRWVAAGYSNPDLKGIFERYGTLQDSLGKIDAGVTNPQQLAQWKMNASTNAETLLKQMSPDANARLQAQTSLTTNANTVDQQERGSVRTDDRARDASSNLTPDGGTSQAGFTKQFGKPSAGYRWKADGSQEAIPGGPADQKAQNTEAGKQTVDTVVATLRSAYESLDKGGGITSTSEGAFSNLSRSASKSSLGQMMGGAVGSTNQKERDAIAQTRPLLLQAIMKATGMSAKQMDSNAELKLYLATATDPTLSLQANREALERIESLYGSKSATAANPTKPSNNVVKDKAAFDALPSGSTFTAPDGTIRRKP